MIRIEVIRVVKSFETGKMLKEANRTFITLIPKVENSKSVKDFGPISLCDFVYKIIAKLW